VLQCFIDESEKQFGPCIRLLSVLSKPCDSLNSCSHDLPSQARDLTIRIGYDALLSFQGQTRLLMQPSIFCMFLFNMENEHISPAVFSVARLQFPAMTEF